MAGSRWVAGLWCALLCACGSVSNDPDGPPPGPDAATSATLTATTSGPGTLSVNPPGGMPCGAGCLTYPIGTTVTIEPTALLSGVRVTSWSGPCAATPAGESCSFTLNRNEIVLATFACGGDFVVDAGSGNDSATGQCGAAFKTIRRGLTVSAVGQTILVLPGTYNAANGETFPMTVDGRVLIGDEADLGEGTVIFNGGNTNTIEARGMATIAGFKITGGATAAFGINLATAGAQVTIRNNQLTGLSDGIWTSASGNHVVTGNRIYMNRARGIAHITGAPMVRYENNHVYNNNLGVETNSPNGDFGGGALSSVGGNHFYCNTRNDLWIYHPDGETLFARNNFFDHNPPTAGADGSGIDAYQANAGPIDSAGAGLTTSPCP